MRYNRLLVFGLLGLALTLGACVKRNVEISSHPPLSVTFLPQKGDLVSKYGNPVDFKEITEIASGYDYILIGEGHRNPVDHKVQQAVLEALSNNGDGLSLGLEMVAVDKQPVLDDFGKGQVAVDGLAEELEWAERWGYPFSHFREHFKIARRNSVPVAGLNVPASVTRKISREGLDALTDEERAYLPGEIVPPATDQRAFLDAIFGMHETKDPGDAVQRERFFLVQSIWDSKMAEEAVRLRKKYDWPVLVVAGEGHVEYGWGIAKRIRWFDPGARVLSIMPWRGESFDDEAGDLFFYSPDSYQSKMGALLTAQPEGGLLVESVERASRAARAGLRPGDVLVEASGVPLQSLMSLHVAGKKVHDADEPLVFTVRRGETSFTSDVGKLGVARKKPAESAAKTEEGNE
ncbi:ChaN family lipoprotein [Pseudodesulfovibrio portus]|uniref:PDZ domain-containing protein n=1 Tax=Pseudodesulfovibrio portus TaxID=231439 RepID=A0ABN6RXN2_9BACT|nr:ChaN family lipoprotein [Pseudodesulfovibrio portus]BDQ34161.1 PDZ domain-containing protein [Pseudodesulfovibrio portus]